MRRETLIVAGGLAIVAAGSLLWFRFSDDAAQQEAVVVVAPPTEPSETANLTGALPPAGAAALPSESEPVDDGRGEILVTTRLSSIYGNPSASAPVLYAFPAGRQLRVLGREGGFVRIKDLQSGATGWVEASTLAPGAAAPASAPTALSTPSASAGPSADGSEPAGESQPAATQAPKPRPSATQRAATRPPATQRTAGQPPLAESGAPQAQAQKQAAKRDAQRAERQGVFPDFLKRAFGGR